LSGDAETRQLTRDEARRIAKNIAKLLDFPIVADGKSPAWCRD
jgi:hypothetical protein